MSTPSRFPRWLTVAFLGASIAACCRQAHFASGDRAAPTLTEEIARLGPRCEQWFVRECDAKGVPAVWFFRPRIDGPAETAAYDGTSGALLYQRQFGESGGWSFTPVRLYGAPPDCRPSLDSTGADKACTWMERRAAAPVVTPSPSPSATDAPATPPPVPTATP